MEYDIKSIAIYTIIATLIASIIDAVFRIKYCCI